MRKTILAISVIAAALVAFASTPAAAARAKAPQVECGQHGCSDMVRSPMAVMPSMQPAQPPRAVRSGPRNGTVVILGIGGRFVAPMTSIIREEQRRVGAANVTVADWFYVPPGNYKRAIGHSAGADAALRTGAPQIRTIDPTFLNPGCPRGADCRNFHASIDAFPFLVCCGGYSVRGAKNIQVPGTPSLIIIAPGHVRMPELPVVRAGVAN